MRARPGTKSAARPAGRRLLDAAARAGLALAVVGLAGPARAVPPNIAGCDLVPITAATEVSVTTPLGTLRIALYKNVAPKTVDNFLAYIRSGAYQDTFFHRTADTAVGSPFIVQGGGYRYTGGTFESIERSAPVQNEPCLSNVRGTVAMAKVAGQPNSATSEWFVNLDSNTSLDTTNGGFTVFGEVVEGLDVADAIAALPRPDQLLLPYSAVVPYALQSALQPMPLLALDEPGVVGCFDVANSGGVLVEAPQSPTDLEPDPATGAPFILASGGCVGAGTDGTPSFACNPPGRRVVLVDPSDGALIPDAQAPFGFAEVTLSCADLAASEAALAERQAIIDVPGNLVTTSYALPEPGPPLLAATALLCLAGLRRRPGRHKGHPRHRVR